jgi:DNA-binding NarL/FixJ family response regulator
MSEKIAKETIPYIKGVSDIRPISILLIEDTPGFVELMMHRFPRELDFDYELLVAGDLASGFEVLKSSSVDVVLLDLSLPDSAPMDTIKNINEIKITAPVIVLTNSEIDDLPLTTIKAGGQQHIPKLKVHEKDLNYEIRAAIERHGRESPEYRLLRRIEGVYPRKKSDTE